MSYSSTNPTDQKRKFYQFMERNKKRGVVGMNKVKEYCRKNGYHLLGLGSSKSSYGKKSTMHWGEVKSGNTIIAELGVRNKKSPVCVWWKVR